MFVCDVMCVIIVVITSLAAFFFYDIATALYLRNVIAFLPTVRFFSNIHSSFEFHYFLNRIFVSLSYDPSIRLPSTQISTTEYKPFIFNPELFCSTHFKSRGRSQFSILKSRSAFCKLYMLHRSLALTCSTASFGFLPNLIYPLTVCTVRLGSIRLTQTPSKLIDITKCWHLIYLIC